MFDDLIRLAKRFQDLDANLILFSILNNEDFKEYIRQLNLKDQLFQGIDSLGVELPPYSAGTQTILDAERENAFSFEGEVKKKIAGEPIFLLSSQEFYDSVTIEITKDSIIFDGNPIKDDGTDLFREYGEEILGLTEENVEKLIQKISEVVVPKILETVTK